MSSTLLSIIPSGALTDDVFAFNQQQFLDIRNAQQKLVLSCLSLETQPLTNWSNVPAT